MQNMVKKRRKIRIWPTTLKEKDLDDYNNEQDECLSQFNVNFYNKKCYNIF